MNDTTTIRQVPENSSKMFRAMVGIGLICALVIVVTYQTTLPVITKNKAEALQKAVFQVIPGAQTRQTFQLASDNKFIPYDGPSGAKGLVYAGYDQQGNLLGVAVEVVGQGFQDAIRYLYGYSPQKQQVIGFQVLESKETPGLGDKIESNEAFHANFKDLDVQVNTSGDAIKNAIVPVKNGTKKNPWEVDCITGATISSKAVSNSLNKSVQYWIPLIHKNEKQFVLGIPTEN